MKRLLTIAVLALCANFANAERVRSYPFTTTILAGTSDSLALSADDATSGNATIARLWGECSQIGVVVPDLNPATSATLSLRDPNNGFVFYTSPAFEDDSTSLVVISSPARGVQLGGLVQVKWDLSGDLTSETTSMKTILYVRD